MAIATLAMCDIDPGDPLQFVRSRLSVNPSAPRDFTPTVMGDTITQVNSNEYAWSVVGRVTHNSDREFDPLTGRPGSESVGVYGQCLKYGRAPCWGGVFECHARNPFGGCFALEVDLMVNGPTPPGGLRDAIQLMVGRARGADQSVRAQVTTAIDIVAAGGDSGAVELQRGIVFNIGCTQSCLQIPSGSQFCLDGAGGDACTKFDAKTGWRGDWNERLNCWSHARHAVTGAEWFQCRELGYKAKDLGRLR